jgi:tRNA (cmo5U34)-methyltransferase
VLFRSAAPPPRDVIFKPEIYIYIKDFGGIHDIGLVAEKDGKIIGAAWTRIIPAYGHIDDETPELAISVLPEHRGQGVGTELLSHLFDLLRWCNCWRTSLSVQKANPAARLYQRMGYKIVRENQDDFIMVKDLTPERMDEFFDSRADTYDQSMLVDLKLDVFYEEIANLIKPARPDFRLLDLGCGTGLELAPLFEKYPDMRVTGIDLSAELLGRLRSKFPGKIMNLICGSYFDVEFDNGFDVVLSTYSLHHFIESEKIWLYKKIRAALATGGMFVFGDFTVPTQELQDKFYAYNTRVRKGYGFPDGEFYHLDIPFTTENEVRVMREAGFRSVEVVRRREKASVIIAS